MFGFNIQRQKRYEQILDTFFQLGRKQGDQEGMKRGYREGYLMGQTEKFNTSVATEIDEPQCLKEARDIIDGSEL